MQESTKQNNNTTIQCNK